MPKLNRYFIAALILVASTHAAISLTGEEYSKACSQQLGEVACLAYAPLSQV